MSPTWPTRAACWRWAASCSSPTAWRTAGSVSPVSPSPTCFRRWAEDSPPPKECSDPSNARQSTLPCALSSGSGVTCRGQWLFRSGGGVGDGEVAGFGERSGPSEDLIQHLNWEFSGGALHHPVVAVEDHPERCAEQAVGLLDLMLAAVEQRREVEVLPLEPLVRREVRLKLVGQCG